LISHLNGELRLLKDKNIKTIIKLVERILQKEKCDYEKLYFEDHQINMCKKRLRGEHISIDEYVEGLLWSQLSAQRVWEYLVEKEEIIDEIFTQYEYEKLLLLAKESRKLTKQLLAVGAGNRMIHNQMKYLRKNLIKLPELYELIESEYLISLSREEMIGLGEKYIQMISYPQSEYKLMFVGPALAGEFLKNIGISVVKMDTHLLRILSQERLGIISCKNEKVSHSEKVQAVREFHAFAKNYSDDIADIIYLDLLFWKLCAKKQANICGKEPKCEKCLLKKICNR